MGDLRISGRHVTNQSHRNLIVKALGKLTGRMVTVKLGDQEYLVKVKDLKEALKAHGKGEELSSRSVRQLDGEDLERVGLIGDQLAIASEGDVDERVDAVAVRRFRSGGSKLRTKLYGFKVLAIAGLKGVPMTIAKGIVRKAKSIFRPQKNALRAGGDEGRWKGALVEGDLQKLLEMLPETETLQERRHSDHSPMDTIRMLANCVAVVGESKPEIWRPILQKLANTRSLSGYDCYDASKALFKAFQEVSGMDKKDFKLAIARQRGLRTPPIENRFKVDGSEFTERVRCGDVSLAASYLEQVGLDDQAGVAREVADSGGARLSESKKDPQMQGVPINLRVHSVQSGDGKTVSVIRSGGFATHGREKILKEQGLEYRGLRHLTTVDDPAVKKEVKHRKKLLMAQALPKVALTVKEIMRHPERLAKAIENGSFLHVETCLMSTATKDERAMIEDFDGAMALVRDNVKIEFGAEEGVQVLADGSVVMTLVSDNPDLEGKRFDMESVLYTQGINTRQALGQMMGKGELQQQINEEALVRLSRYAGGESADRLEAHFHSRQGQQAQDITGMMLVDEIVESAGGVVNWNCKSGKDRTGAAVDHKFSIAFDDPQVGQQTKAGGSRKIAGQNVGLHRKDLYAFNEFQVIADGLGPPAHMRAVLSAET